MKGAAAAVVGAAVTVCLFCVLAVVVVFAAAEQPPPPQAAKLAPVAAVGGLPATWGETTDVAQRATWSAMALQAGCPQIAANRDTWVTATAITGAESAYIPTQLNDNRSTGDLSYGLGQINMIDDLGPERLVQFGISTNEELFDAVTNARAICVLSGGGENFEPWSTFKRGEHERHLSEADAAINRITTGTALSEPALPAESAAAGTLVTVPNCVADDCELDGNWAPKLLGVLSLCRQQFDIVIYSANRSFEEQSILYARYKAGIGGLAARPGTSNHEGGQAVDLVWAGKYSGIGPGDGAWECMHDNGPRYGVYQSPEITDSDSVHFSVTGN